MNRSSTGNKNPSVIVEDIVKQWLPKDGRRRLWTKVATRENKRSKLRVARRQLPSGRFSYQRIRGTQPTSPVRTFSEGIIDPGLLVPYTTGHIATPLHPIPMILLVLPHRVVHRPPIPTSPHGMRIQRVDLVRILDRVEL